MKLLFAHLPRAITGTFCLLLLTACGGGSGGREEQPEPDPPLQNFVVRGELFSNETGMIANAPINLWIQSGDSGFAMPLSSDGLGRFETEVSPQSEITLFASKDGFVQPCAVRSHVTQDVEVRIEMLPVSALNVVNAPLPQSSAEPSVTGTIFETTPDGRQIIAGANLWLEWGVGIPVATTTTDLRGGFYLCNLPTDTYIYISKTGFKEYVVGPIGGPEAAALEIEMEREIE